MARSGPAQGRARNESLREIIRSDVYELHYKVDAHFHGTAARGDPRFSQLRWFASDWPPTEAESFPTPVDT